MAQPPPKKPAVPAAVKPKPAPVALRNLYGQTARDMSRSLLTRRVLEALDRRAGQAGPRGKT